MFDSLACPQCGKLPDPDHYVFFQTGFSLEFPNKCAGCINKDFYQKGVVCNPHNLEHQINGGQIYETKADDKTTTRNVRDLALSMLYSSNVSSLKKQRALELLPTQTLVAQGFAMYVDDPEWNNDVVETWLARHKYFMDIGAEKSKFKRKDKGEHDKYRSFKLAFPAEYKKAMTEDRPFKYLVGPKSDSGRW